MKPSPLSPGFAVWLALSALLAAPPIFGGESPPAVSVTQASTLDRAQPKTFVGVVQGAEQVNIVARVSGTLIRVNFQEGADVKAGDVLFEIEDIVYEARVAIARALIEQGEADHELAVKEHQRSDELLKSRAIATQSFDMTLSTEKLKKAKVDEARANLVLALHDLEHCRIVSPITGRIGEKKFSEGNYITPTSGTLAVVVQYQPIKVRFSMSESDFFHYLHKHDQLQNVDLEIVRANGKPYTGNAKTDFVDNLVDPNTDTITVFLECDNPGNQLLPGGYVQIRLSEKYPTPLVAVPASAVMTDGRNHYLYVVGKDDVVERRAVVTGDLVFDRQTIREGLAPGEMVVTGGMNKTTPGMKVRPVPIDAARTDSDVK